MAETLQKEANKSLARISAGPRGLSLATLEDMWRFSQYVARSGLAPKGVDTPEAILVALQMGAELGLTPMASLQNIAVINGRPSVWGDAMLAVCRGSGLFDEEAFIEEPCGQAATDNYGAYCRVRRLPNGHPIERTFTVADAKKAGLWGKTGPWTQYTKRMFQMRARSWALRDGFSDVLRGFLSAEEVRDIAGSGATAAIGGPGVTGLLQRLEAQSEPVAEPPDDPPYNPPTAAEQAAEEPAVESQVDPAVEAAEGPDEIPPEPPEPSVNEDAEPTSEDRRKFYATRIDKGPASEAFAGALETEISADPWLNSQDYQALKQALHQKLIERKTKRGKKSDE